MQIDVKCVTVHLAIIATLTNKKAMLLINIDFLMFVESVTQVT